MTETKWTQTMDGSPAKVDLLGAMLNAQALEGIDVAGGPLSFFALAHSRINDGPWGAIVWQHGPIQEVGRNGILFEELLEFVVIPRLQGFNRDRIPCPGECRGGTMRGSVPCSRCGVGPARAKNDDGTIPNPFRNRETSLAITHLEEGLNWLKRRTELRQRQKVEGTFQPHRSA